MEVVNWLLKSSPYVEYATRINILKEDKASLLALRKVVLNDIRIKAYLNNISNFNAIIVTNHKNPILPIQQLIFLFDIGLDVEVPEIAQAIQQILGNKAEDGIYKSMTNIPSHYGGTGENTLAWSLCDAPLMFISLLKADLPYEKHLKTGVEYMLSLKQENGFSCIVSQELGKFRGPGKKTDCCPYATLIILQLLALIPEYKKSDLAKICINSLLSLWEHSKEQHPYMFFMGNDFRKLKAPTIWFDIVSLTDCISNYEFARKDMRFQEMIAIITSKANQARQFTPESIYQKCKDWDFGQKKQPSAWLTYICLRILERNGSFNFEG